LRSPRQRTKRVMFRDLHNIWRGVMQIKKYMFCYFKKLHNAAIVVQKHFRLKKIPEHPTLNGQSIRIQIPQNNSSLLREHRAATTIQLAYRGHRKRQAAARKIQKFMKESHKNGKRYLTESIGVISQMLKIFI
uniref:Ribosomal_L18A domain-containing protein n=1 Tax=Angiostrongylus cantonensis TaxID=6313 RepID=A0A0K0DMF6_ANGCA